MKKLTDLPEAGAKAALALQATVRHGSAVPPMRVMELKRLLKAHFDVPDAFQLYRNAIAPGQGVRLRRQEIVFQRDAAEATALDMRVVHAGGEAVELRPPTIIGEARTAPIRGRTRQIFIACFEDATAYSRSSTIRLRDGTFAFDLQFGEYGTVPVDLSFDPLVFDAHGKEVDCIEDTRAQTLLRLPEALTLLGLDTVSFGHWMMEEMGKFLTARSFTDLRHLPILIDAGLPPQHKESIVAFVGPNHPVIEVPRFTRVEVNRLWICSNWAYSPKILLTDIGVDTSRFVYPYSLAARFYSQSWIELASKIDSGNDAGGIFIARDQSRHRGIANGEAVFDALNQLGFRDVRPESLSFMDQFRMYRSHKSIVIQSGSAYMGILMCTPGTRVCLLSHDWLPFIALWGQILQEMGIEVTILTGTVAEHSPVHADRSTYSIDIDSLKRLLQSW